MTNPEIYTGTVGAEVEIATGTDLVTGVTAVTIAVRRPDGTVTAWEPDSVDVIGVVVYTTVAGDLDQGGTYTLQPVVTYSNGEVWPLGAVAWPIVPRFQRTP
ncbi:MAG TPA: hypothetical protein HA263_07970 [Methanoregulaceae archaeon]|nr:hypothetical protein [Methanoregulaceae archaeon]